MDEYLIPTQFGEDEFYEKNAGGNFYYFSTKALKCYTEIEYPEYSYLIFGKESAVIPEEILQKNLDKYHFCDKLLRFSFAERSLNAYARF